MKIKNVIKPKQKLKDVLKLFGSAKGASPFVRERADNNSQKDSTT